MVRLLMLIILILRSTSSACSFAAIVFTPRMGTRFESFSNSLLIRTVPTWVQIMQVMPAASCFAVWDEDEVNSAITKLRPLAMLTRNGTPLTNMTSTANVTSRCYSRTAQGIYT
jgi:hypothetical protein